MNDLSFEIRLVIAIQFWSGIAISALALALYENYSKLWIIAGTVFLAGHLTAGILETFLASLNRPFASHWSIVFGHIVMPTLVLLGIDLITGDQVSLLKIAICILVANITYVALQGLFATRDLLRH